MRANEAETRIELFAVALDCEVDPLSDMPLRVAAPCTRRRIAPAVKLPGALL